MWYSMLGLALLAPGQASPLRADEVVTLYPTAARLEVDGEHWIGPIHGRVFEPERNSVKRAVALGTLRRMLRLDRDAAESQVFKTRAAAFLVDNESGKRISVRIAGKTVTCPASDAGGHFHAELRIRNADIPVEQAEQGWLPIEAITPRNDPRRFLGAVRLMAPRGWSVISDVDDTIKISQVTDKRALWANTFLREFQPVPEMADVYQVWADAGATFHYLTSSPWQLYRPLEDFRSEHGFPPGTYHMKRFRLKDSTALSLLDQPERGKLPVIKALMTGFPQRKFILVGDSGERDPEIYGTIARKYPDQVAAVYIRNVTAETSDDRRFAAAFDGVSAERWRLFDEAGEIEQAARALIVMED